MTEPIKPLSPDDKEAFAPTDAPDVAADATPDTAPGVAPDVAADATPDVAADAAADASDPAAQDAVCEDESDDEGWDEEWDLDFDDTEAYMEDLIPLMQKVEQSGGMSLMAADGFLHGLICLPGRNDPTMYLGAVLCDENGSLLLEGQELRDVLELLFERYNSLLNAVEDGIFYTDPLIIPLEMDDYYPDQRAEKGEEAGESEETEEDAAAADAEDEAGEAKEPEACEQDPCTVADADGVEDVEHQLLLAREKQRLLAKSWLDRLAQQEIEECKDWSRGFVLALDEGGVLDRILTDESMSYLLAPTMCLIGNEMPPREKGEEGRPLTPEEHDKFLHLLSPSISELYRLLRRPVVRKQKISRNDPCPCGSGKKYKKCCLNKPDSDREPV